MQCHSCDFAQLVGAAVSDAMCGSSGFGSTGMSDAAPRQAAGGKA